MLESAKRTPRSKLYKPVVCLELQLSFESIKRAAQEVGANTVEIGKCCKNIKLTSGGIIGCFMKILLSILQKKS